MRAPLAVTAVVLASATALVGASPAGRQDAPKAAPVAQAAQPQPPPVFRSGTDLVRLDIRVTDADGRPIEDLRADEIEIAESGAPRPVLFFQHIQQPQGTYTDAARRTVAAEVSTNQGAPRGSVYVLVFDQWHIRPGNEQRARHAAERFLRMRVKPGDRMALYALPGPGPAIPFTSDVARVNRELSKVVGTWEDLAHGIPPMRAFDAYQIMRGDPAVLGRYAEGWVNTGGSDTPAQGGSRAADPLRAGESSEMVRKIVKDSAATIVARADDWSRQFLLRLSDIVRELRSVEGRKSVLVFSEGFEIDNVRRELETVAAAAAQSYSVVYAIDLNPRAVAMTEEEPRGGEQYNEIQSKLEPLGSLAAQTDGVLFNDAAPQIDRVLNQIADTSQDYYLVGFAPGADSLADRDRYKAVKVTVKRPGARVSARTGYAVGAAPNPADRRRTIEAALGAPFAQQGLRVEYTTYVLRGTAADTQRVILSASAEMPVGSTASSQADVVFAVRSVRTGQMAASGSDTMPLPSATRPGATTGTGYYRAQMDLPPGVYMMRVVVREPGGLLGSADRRFQVRALNGPGVQAGDLILGSSDVRGLPVRPAVYASEAIDGVFETYSRMAGALTPLTVLVELLPFGKPAALTTGRAELGAVQTTSAGASRSARVTIPVQDVPPGEYLVRATVRSGSEHVAELLREVTVLEGSRPAPPPVAAALAASLQDVAPGALLGGDIVRRYVDDIATRASGQPLERAAAQARLARWADVEAAVPAGLSSTDAQALVGLARFGRRDFAGARAAWQIVVDADATNACAAFLLGWAQAAAGNDRAAVSAWRSAIIADAAMVPAYLAAIDAYLRLGQQDLALQIARSGLQAMPASAELRDRVAKLEGR